MGNTKTIVRKFTTLPTASDLEDGEEVMYLNEKYQNQGGNIVKTYSKPTTVVTTYTFATLPIADDGQLEIITDASSVGYRLDAAGGGSDVALVMWSKTKWIYS